MLFCFSLVPPPLPLPFLMPPCSPTSIVRVVKEGDSFVPKNSDEVDNSLDLSGYMMPMGFQDELKKKFPEKWMAYENWVQSEKNVMLKREGKPELPLPHPNLK